MLRVRPCGRLPALGHAKPSSISGGGDVWPLAAGAVSRDVGSSVPGPPPSLTDRRVFGLPRAALRRSPCALNRTPFQETPSGSHASCAAGGGKPSCLLPAAAAAVRVVGIIAAWAGGGSPSPYPRTLRKILRQANGEGRSSECDGSVRRGGAGL